MSESNETQNPSQVIKIAKIRLYNGQNQTRAFVDLRIGPFVLKGFTVVENTDKSGFFVSPPSKLNEDKNYHIIFVDPDFMDRVLRRFVVEEYKLEAERVSKGLPESDNYSNRVMHY